MIKILTMNISINCMKEKLVDKNRNALNIFIIHFIENVIPVQI